MRKRTSNWVGTSPHGRPYRHGAGPVLGRGGARPPADLAELNRLFSAWVETVYHRRAHSETGEAPIERCSRRPAGVAHSRPAA